MRYWWVNQNQTYRQEVSGGYLWSPQRKRDGTRNAFYETMREVSPDDVVFSFSGTYIKAIGVAQSYCYECPKPLEFGSAGMVWDDVGWRVDVAFREESLPVRPSDHMTQIRPHLPERYAPLRPDGRGLQAVYLTELSRSLAEALATLMGRPILDLVRGEVTGESKLNVLQMVGSPNPSMEWERELTNRIERDSTISDTEKAQLVLARGGQGEFRRKVRLIEHSCRVTKVDREEHLRASHCKPWRDSSNDERLDGENGLLLTPSIDHLFDRGFITFESSGRLVISNVAHPDSLHKMGIILDEPVNVGSFTNRQKDYLAHHREHIFLERGK